MDLALFFFAILISLSLTLYGVDGSLKVEEVALWQEIWTPVTGKKLGGES